MAGADLSDNRQRAEETLRVALALLGLLPERAWVKSGQWAAAVGVVCDVLDDAEHGRRPCQSTTTPGR
jgi:hypothetical protein